MITRPGTDKALRNGPLAEAHWITVSGRLHGFKIAVRSSAEMSGPRRLNFAVRPSKVSWPMKTSHNSPVGFAISFVKMPVIREQSFSSSLSSPMTKVCSPPFAAANEQLAGKLSQRINLLRDDLMLTLAHVEAHLDFPDEDLSPDTKEKLLQRLENGVAFMAELLRTANEGQILHRGIRAAIVGRPNAGKSSLLNQLLGRDRAIVSPIAGTTRDTIEETANIRGLPVIFIDTAACARRAMALNLKASAAAANHSRRRN